MSTSFSCIHIQFTKKLYAVLKNSIFNILRPRQDYRASILHIISKCTFVSKEIYEFILQSSLHFVPTGANDYKLQSVQAMAWRRTDTKPLHESVVVQFNGAYIRLWHWVDYFTVQGKHNDKMRRRTVVLEPGNYLHPIAESGQFQPLGSGRVEGRVDHIL